MVKNDFIFLGENVSTPMGNHIYVCVYACTESLFLSFRFLRCSCMLMYGLLPGA